MNRLDKSVESLVESYKEFGVVNHSGAVNLPSRESVMDILADLDEILFPGFRENEDLNHDNLKMFTAERANRLARKLMTEVEKSISFSSRNGAFSCGRGGCHAVAQIIVDDFFEALPEIRRVLLTDVYAACKGDPAAKSVEEVIVSYPGVEAITVHRIANFFWKRDVPLIPRMMSEIAHGRTGIDIHPGAAIGESFFIDHGTGVVIGGTSIIGKNVKLYQGVTLGALSVKKGEADKKRHPTIEDDVTIYAGATILGGETVIGKGCVIGGNVWITESIPRDTMVFVKNSEQGVKTKSH
jgi:serine O-acetyltransferase